MLNTLPGLLKSLDAEFSGLGKNSGLNSRDLGFGSLDVWCFLVYNLRIRCRAPSGSVIPRSCALLKSVAGVESLAQLSLLHYCWCFGIC